MRAVARAVNFELLDPSARVLIALGAFGWQALLATLADLRLDGAPAQRPHSRTAPRSAWSPPTVAWSPCSAASTCPSRTPSPDA